MPWRRRAHAELGSDRIGAVPSTSIGSANARKVHCNSSAKRAHRMLHAALCMQHAAHYILCAACCDCRRWHATPSGGCTSVADICTPKECAAGAHASCSRISAPPSRTAERAGSDSPASLRGHSNAELAHCSATSERDSLWVCAPSMHAGPYGRIGYSGYSYGCYYIRWAISGLPHTGDNHRPFALRMVCTRSIACSLPSDVVEPHVEAVARELRTAQLHSGAERSVRLTAHRRCVCLGWMDWVGQR